MSPFKAVVLSSLFAASGCLLSACEKPAEKPASGSSSKDHSQGDGHDHSHDGKDDHGHDHGHDVALGSVKIGAWDVKVSRGEELKAGSATYLDVELSGSTDAPAAIRGWIGSEDAKGAVKGKADGEGMDRHIDVEVPNPIPTGAKLWIEIEDAKGGKHVGGFDLKA